MTDDNLPIPGAEGPKDPMETYGEMFREKADELENAARKVGLYLRDAGLTMVPNLHGDVAMEPALIANFTVGDQAWSDRVQNPEQNSTEAEFRKMAVEMEKDKFEETRAELERRLREGKDLLGSDDDDDGTSPTA